MRITERQFKPVSNRCGSSFVSTMMISRRDHFLERLFTVSGVSIAFLLHIYLALASIASLDLNSMQSRDNEIAPSRAMTNLGDSTTQRRHSFQTKQELVMAVDLWFTNQSQAIDRYGQLFLWDVSRMSDLSFVFSNKPLQNEDFSAWDVSNCRNFSHIFANATHFDADLSAWCMTNSIDLSHMFDNAVAFQGDLSTWNLNSAVFLNAMLKNAKSFNGNVSRWFHQPSVGTMSVETGLVVRYAQNFESLFEGASSFQGHGLADWNTEAVYNMKSIFRNAVSLQSVGQWNTLLVQDASFAFQNTPEFEQELCWTLPESADTTMMFDGSRGMLKDDCESLFDWMSSSSSTTNSFDSAGNILFFLLATTSLLRNLF